MNPKDSSRVVAQSSNYNVARRSPYMHSSMHSTFRSEHLSRKRPGSHTGSPAATGSSIQPDSRWVCLFSS